MAKKTNTKSLFAGVSPIREYVDESEQDKTSTKNSKVKEFTGEEDAAPTTETTEELPMNTSEIPENLTDKAETDTSAQEETADTEMKGAESIASKFFGPPKEKTRKKSRSLYIEDANYEKLTKLAEAQGISISEVLNTILGRVL